MLDLGFRRGHGIHPENHARDKADAAVLGDAVPRGIVVLTKLSTSSRLFGSTSPGKDEGGHADIEYRAIRIAAADVEHGVVNALRFPAVRRARSYFAIPEMPSIIWADRAAGALLAFSVVALSGRFDPERADPRASSLA